VQIIEPVENASDSGRPPLFIGADRRGSSRCPRQPFILARNQYGLSAQGLVETNVNDILAVLAIIGVIFAARALTDPIQKLVEGTRTIAAGDLTARMPVKSSDELGVLAASFNQMADELLTRNTEIVKANESLSEREAHLRLITEVTNDAIYDWDIARWNTAATALLMLTSSINIIVRNMNRSSAPCLR